MAVVVTVAKGYDLGYVWKNQAQEGHGEEHRRLLHQRRPGRGAARPLVGPGAQALGFTAGQVVEREPYDAVYQQFDPRTGEKLGRARGSY